MKEKWILSEDEKVFYKSSLQENLTALRAKAGISQMEIAQIIGLSRQSYYGIETGKKEMSWSIYCALIFFFQGLSLTKNMLNELGIYPVSIFEKFNR